MRRDAKIGGAVHVARPDLDLEQLTAWAEHRRMQRLIAVGLRLRDVILDALLHRCPSVVDHAERVVTLQHVRYDHANGQQVVNILIRTIALLHLLVDRPQVLRPARDVNVGNARVREPFLERLAHLRDQLLPLATLCRHQFREGFVRVRLEMLERQIFELPADLRHTEAVSQRRVEVTRFLRNASLFLGFEIVESAHVVQSIGQLDEDDAGILGNRQQQLSIVLNLSLLTGRERQICNLREAIDDLRDLGSKLARDILDGDGGVLNDVVE